MVLTVINTSNKAGVVVVVKVLLHIKFSSYGVSSEALIVRVHVFAQIPSSHFETSLWKKRLFAAKIGELILLFFVTYSLSHPFTFFLINPSKGKPFSPFLFFQPYLRLIYALDA